MFIKRIGLLCLVLLFVTFGSISLYQLAAAQEIKPDAASGRDGATAVPENAPSSILPSQARDLAIAMGIPANQIISASYNGSDEDAFGIGDTPLGTYFPSNGNTFAILATGLASSADQPNDEGSLSNVLGGLNNNVDEDLVQLDLMLNPPAGALCASFDFAFYSEEFPEFVDSPYNDTFTAELGGTDLEVVLITSTFEYEVIAPLNFAFGTQHEIIAVNSAFGVGDITNSTYDGVTPLLRASTPIESGAPVNIVFSVQDLGDSIYDSAVFLDNFFWSSDPECSEGAGFAPEITPILPGVGGILSYTNLDGTHTTVDVPADAISDTIYLVFQKFISPTNPLNGPSVIQTPDSGSLQYANRAFNLKAILAAYKAYLPLVVNNSTPGMAAATTSAPLNITTSDGDVTLLHPMQITLEYSDEDIADISDEASLRLYQWNGSAWIDAVTTCAGGTAADYTSDTAANYVQLPVCTFGEFMMAGN
ncbi:MAG: choice-of-anchor L domain-containing protein [Chloroflexota bacterium]